MDLTNHRVFITGGTRGIGWELAKALVARGAPVALCGRDEERLAEIRQQLPEVSALRCDLSDLDGLPAFVDELEEAFGSPTVLVNNAGIQFNHSWLDTPHHELMDRLRLEIRVNLTSPLALTALLLEDLARGSEAALVNVSSTLALSPKVTAPVYCATKAAIHSFTQALRYQLDAHPNVRVVEVFPPLVDTAMTQGRGTGKISPALAAREIVQGLERDKTEIYIGKAKVLRVLHSFAPGLVARILRGG
jgi:uncharacterized oxidoreductase